MSDSLVPDALRSIQHRRSGYEPVSESSVEIAAFDVASPRDAGGDGDAGAKGGRKRREFRVAEDPADNALSILCPSLLSCFLSLVLPTTWVAGVRRNREGEAALVMHFGKFSGVRSRPGLFCFNPVGFSTRTVSLKERTTELRSVSLSLSLSLTSPLAHPYAHTRTHAYTRCHFL